MSADWTFYPQLFDLSADFELKQPPPGDAMLAASEPP
jgi:hypothetical protein